MSIEQMRKIDFWLGIPLCFISSLWFNFWLRLNLSLRQIFIKHAQPSAEKLPSNTLVIGLSEMGSLVLAQASLNKLATNSTLYFICFKKNKPALELLDIISSKNVFTLDESKLSYFIRDTFRFFYWSRKNNITTVVDLELFSRFSALLGAYSGASKHIGFYRYHTEGLYRGTFFTHPIAYNPHIHISKNFMSLAYSASLPLIEQSQHPLSKQYFSTQDIAITKAIIEKSEKEQVRKIIQQFYPDYNQQTIILINSEGGDLLPMRNWGQDNFYELIGLILNKNNNADTLMSTYLSPLILLTGADNERAAIEKLSQKINLPQCINFAGAVSLKQLLALYSISQYMVTNDSGPNHFASLTSIKTYTLFGPETPDLYGSLGNTTNIYKRLACSPCVTAANQRKTACSDNVCMQQIKPLEVYQIINNIEK
jgi:ADP-heptose:LPS heptosyltransferase